MKLLVRVLFILFILIGVLIAVSNRQPVQLALWPLPHLVVMPVYLLVIGMLLLGVLAGLGMGWWAGRHHRRRAREASGEAARLDREVQRLREAAQSTGSGAGERARATRPEGDRAAERLWSRPNSPRRPARAAPSREDPLGRRGRRRSRRPGADRSPRRAVPRRLRDAGAPSSLDCPADRPRLGRRHAAPDAGLDARARKPSRHQGGHGLPRQRPPLAALDLRPVPAARRHDRPDGGDAGRHHADQAAHRLRLGAGLALPVAARCATAR